MILRTSGNRSFHRISAAVQDAIKMWSTACEAYGNPVLASGTSSACHSPGVPERPIR